MLNPVQGSAFDEGLAASVAGSSSVLGSLNIRQSLSCAVACSSLVNADIALESGFRAISAGLSSITATLTAALELEGAISGNSQSQAALRIDDEANVFFEAAVTGLSGLELELGLKRKLSGLSQGISTASATLFVERGESFGFTIYVDILSSQFVSGAIKRYDYRLTADGVPVPIQNFAINAPEDALGISLSATLARTSDRALLTPEAEITLEVGLWNGSDYLWIPRLPGGRAISSRHDIGYADNRPTDSFQFGANDYLADRWTLRPDVPATYYDPLKMDAPQPPGRGQLVQDVGEPEYIGVAGLSLHQVLDLAYVEGCGFDEVITNIPDFPVTEVSFTLSGGYHSGVSPLLSLFEPVYFADGNTLWIVDAGAQLPAGVTARSLPLSAVVTVSESKTVSLPVTAIILEYKQEGGDYFTERVETDPPIEAGSFESAGYTRQEISRRIREYRKTSAPDVVVREEQVEQTTETYANRPTVEAGAYELGLVGREIIHERFDTLNRKSGHTRTVEGWLPTVEAGAYELQHFLEENYSVSYRQSNVAGVDEMAQTVMLISGLVLVDEDDTYLDKPYELPYMDAHASGRINPAGSQHTEFKAIRTIVENYERKGASVEVRRIPTYHLNGTTVENPTVQTRAGSIGLSRRSQGTVRKLIGVEGGTARIIPTFSAGELPGELAELLAERKLVRLNEPPRDLQAGIYGLMADVRRGLVVEAYDREGEAGNYILTAFQEQGRRQGEGFEVAQSATGKELK